MRPYRAIPVGGKDFVYGSYTHVHDVDGNPSIIPTGKNVFVSVIPETVGQSTGLHDKNGRGDEIYAGSLVWRVDSKDTYAVIWRKVHGQWWLREYKQGKLREWATPLMVAAAKEYLTLCGNIHQNPEIIKENDNEDKSI